MGYLEDLIIQMVESRQKGISEEETVRLLQVPSSTHIFYRSFFKKKIDRALKAGNLDSRLVVAQIPISPLQQIQEAIARGVVSRQAITKDTGATYKIVCQIISDYKLLPKKRDQTILKIKAAHALGLTLQQAARELKIPPLSLQSTAKNYGLPEFVSVQEAPTRENARIARHRENPNYSEFYKMVRQGQSIVQIGNRLNCTRQRVEQIIKEEGLYNIWRKSREHYRQHAYVQEHGKEREIFEKREEFYGVLMQRLHEQLSSKKCEWAEKKTVEYILHRQSRGERNVRPHKLYVVYQGYDKARQQGKTRSFVSLGKRVGLRGPEVGRILKAGNCSSLNWSVVYRPRLSRKDKKAIKEACTLNMPLRDLVYFSERSKIVFTSYGLKQKPVPSLKQFFIHEPRLTYALASQIYEAHDLRFSKSEIRELLEIPLKHISYALKHRTEIVPIIMAALHTLHPKERYERPYLSSKVS